MNVHADVARDDRQSGAGLSSHNASFYQEAEDEDCESPSMDVSVAPTRPTADADDRYQAVLDKFQHIWSKAI